jgi:predicted secreted protein
MGIVHAQRGRLAPAAILAVLMALAAILTLGILAGPASAQATFATCASCHNDAKGIHAGATHGSTGCGTCHVGGFSAANKGVTPAACASCHTDVAGTLAKPTHTANACGTTPGCHGVPPATVTTTMSLKVSPTSVKVKKSVKVTGTAGPAASLAGAKVSLKVERKVGAKWTKMKTGTTTVKASGAYTWTYKTTKKGAHRVTASIAKTSTYTAKKMVKSFKVK